MKTKVALLAVILMIMLKTTVYAASSQVDVKISGNVKNGSSVDIIFNVKDVSRLYAGSVEFTYDPSVMKVESISGGEFIKTNNPKIMEFGGDTAKNGNIADYYFTCVGKVDGFTGSGSFVVVKANVLNQDKFNIYKKNLKIQLVERNTNNEMKDITYTIGGDVKDEASPSNSGSTEPSNSSGKDPVSQDGTNKPGTSDKGQNDSSSGSSSNNSSKDSGSKASTSNESKENKGFIATVIDNIKSVFSGSSSKDDSKKQIDDSNTSNKTNSSNTNESSDKNSVENKVGNTTDSTKPNKDTVSKEGKNTNSNVASNNSSVGVGVSVVILVAVLVTAAGIVIKKRNNKK